MVKPGLAEVQSLDGCGSKQAMSEPGFFGVILNAICSSPWERYMRSQDRAYAELVRETEKLNGKYRRKYAWLLAERHKEWCERNESKNV